MDKFLALEVLITDMQKEGLRFYEERAKNMSLFWGAKMQADSMSWATEALRNL